MATVTPISSDDWTAHLPVPQITMTVYIPTMCVGAVIGRRGSTIAQIQKQAQQTAPPNAPPVRVSIVGHSSGGGEGTAMNLQSNNKETTSLAATTGSPSSPILTNEGATTPTGNGVDPPASVPYTHTPLDWSDPQWTPVVIRADPAAALFVAQKLESLCTCLQDTIVDMPIGRQRHAAIVGKRGITLMQLSSDNKCRIWVPPKELKLDIVQLEGQLENCIQTLKALTIILAHDKSKATHQGQITVPQLPSQTKLRSVGRKTDTLIKKKKLEDDAWQLTILGTSETQVQSAVQILQKWSEQVAPSSGGVGGGGGERVEGSLSPTSGGGGGRGGNSNTNKGGGGGRGGGRGGGPGRGGKPRKGKPRGGGKNSAEPPSSNKTTTE